MKKPGIVGGAVAVVAIWGLVWAVPGFGIELLSNLGVRIGGDVDMWPATLGLPGLVAGVVFCALLAVTGRLRTLEASPTSLLLGLGTLVGLVMAGIVATGVVGGEESAGTYVFVVAMSAIAAVASGLVFRMLAGGPARARARA